MLFQSENSLEPQHGSTYREVIETCDKLLSLVPGIPVLWKLFWKAGKLVRPAEFSKVEEASRSAAKSYTEMERLWADLDKNLGYIERNLRRNGGLVGASGTDFNRTANHSTISEIRGEAKAMRDELEKFLAALEVCKMAVEKKPEAERLWRDLGQLEIQLTRTEESLRKMHAESARRFRPL